MPMGDSEGEKMIAELLENCIYRTLRDYQKTIALLNKNKNDSTEGCIEASFVVMQRMVLSRLGRHVESDHFS